MPALRRRFTSPSSPSSLPTLLALASVLARNAPPPATAAVVSTPRSNCFAFDNSSRLVDFSSWIGHHFEYEGKDADLVVRFCKDVESRSQSGYVDFGRFDKFNHFVSGSGDVDFVQGFYNGDLVNCETSYDKMGRTSQVYDGMTQLGYEKPHQEFSFGTEQIHVTLYITSISSQFTLVQKPIIKVFPESGLEVRLSGSGLTGIPPTTLSPTMLNIYWRCKQTRDIPYEVNVTIPIEGHEPVEFILAKMCEYRQHEDGGSTRGWAIFGALSCIFIVSSTLFCCGGFIYKTHVGGKRGIDALPGITIVSACLETVSGAGQSYIRAEYLNNSYANEASWEQSPASYQGIQRPATESKYGAI